MDYRQVKQRAARRFGIGVVLAVIASAAVFAAEVATDGFRHDFGPTWLVPLIVSVVVALSLVALLTCLTVIRQLLRLRHVPYV